MGKRIFFVPGEYTSLTTEESNVMHSPVNMPIFVKNVTTDIHDQNAHLETEQGLLNPAPLEKSEYLVKGFSFSFRLGCVGSPISPSPKIINQHKIILRSLRNTLGRVYNPKE